MFLRLWAFGNWQVLTSPRHCGQAAVEAGLGGCLGSPSKTSVPLVRRHRADDSIARALTRIIRSDLIIVDDIGLLPVSEDAAEGFYFASSTLPNERRGDCRLEQPAPLRLRRDHAQTLATATVDRLLHHAHVVVTDGDSFRLTEATTGKGVKPFS